LFVTVSGILLHFGADRVGLSAKEDIVVSSFSAFGVEKWAAYSDDFLFSDVVSVIFSNPPPIVPFCQTKTVFAVFFPHFPNTIGASPNTITFSNTLEVSGESCFRGLVLPFTIDLGDACLDARCVQLVLSPLNHTPSTAAGISPPAEVVSTFATTQAAWRFFHNPQVTLSALAQPLREFTQHQIAALPPSVMGFVLGVIDRSKIDYSKHSSKKDVVAFNS
jgi:hypothetical protein